MCKVLVVPTLPDAAVGVHKVSKVKILRTNLDTGFGSNIDYPIILLDNGVTFSLFPRGYKIREIHKGGGTIEIYGYAFSNAENCLIMGEGCEFDLRKK